MGNALPSAFVVVFIVVFKSSQMPADPALFLKRSGFFISIPLPPNLVMPRHFFVGFLFLAE
jgi:hypothetical protein